MKQKGEKKLELDGATEMDLLTAMLLLVKEIKINTGWTNKDILSEVDRMLKKEEEISKEKGK